jgi:hypothetical protein
MGKKNQEPDRMEKEFLTSIQKSFPISRRPFADLARELLFLEETYPFIFSLLNQ